MDKKIQVIDFRLIIRKLYTRKRFLLCISIVTIILSGMYIVSIPRYYNTETKLAPEVENPNGGGSLGSLASSFGIDLANIKSADAITPLLYPDLMKDNKFVFNLLPITITTSNAKVHTNYYEYLTKHQQEPTWLTWLGRQKIQGNLPPAGTNPYRLTKEQDEVIQLIRENISLTVDQKNGVITIKTQDQDPLVCKTLADSVRDKLQTFITIYRTNKARKDVAYYNKLTNEAKAEYEKARRVYGSYSDANNDIVLESFRSKTEDLENDMQLKYNNYSSLVAQLQTAKAKLQERTPAFTILQGASVPIKPTGPKRMVFVFMITLLVFTVSSLWILRKDIGKLFT